MWNGNGMRDDVEREVRRLAAEQLGVDPDDLSSEMSLTDDLAADSLDLVELGLALEDELGISMPDRLLEDVRSFGQLVEATVAALPRPAFGAGAE